MAVGDLSTDFLDAQVMSYVGHVAGNSEFFITRGYGSTIFVGVFSKSTSSGGARHIDLMSFGISTAGVINTSPLHQVTVNASGGAGGGARRYDLIGNQAGGVVIVAWAGTTADNSPRISTYTVDSTGGLTAVSTVIMDTSIDVSAVTLYVSRITGDVYLLSYRRDTPPDQGWGVTFSVSSTGGITSPLDGPEALDPAGQVAGSHPAIWTLSSIMVVSSTNSRLRTHTMTAGGVFSTALHTSTFSGTGADVGLASLLTLDSGLGIIAFNHNTSSGSYNIRTAIIDSTGGITLVSSTLGINSIGMVDNQRMMNLGSRAFLFMEDAQSPARLRTYVVDAAGVLSTVDLLLSTGIMVSNTLPSFAHVSGSVVAVGSIQPSSTAALTVATFTVENALTAASVLGLGIFVDWNNDGTFSSTEDISTDCLRLSWRRGREAEQSETPIGTGTIELKDPNADYNPLSTGSKWGSTFVRVNREVLARMTFGTSTYNLFRGRIERITPQASPEWTRASIFVVDGMAELRQKIISYPNGAGTTAGASPSSGDRPVLIAIGSTLGGIAAILDEASWGTTRRKLSETGSTLNNYWTYGESAMAAIALLERQEFRGLVFIDRDGDVAFHSSTHAGGSTFLASFNVQFQGWDHSFSARPIINSAEVSVHARDDATAALLGSINPSIIPSITQGTTQIFIIPLSPAPVANVVIPAINVNATGSAAAVGVGTGTSYSSTQVTVIGQVLGASALKLFVANNTTETINIQRAENAADTQTAFQVAGTALNDGKWGTTAQLSGSIAEFGRRHLTLDLPFVSVVATAVNRSVDIVTRFGAMRADFTKLSIAGTDTTIVEQLLARNINDRIRVTSTNLKITNRDYYITAAEYEIAPGNFAGLGLAMAAVWTLEEAT